MALPSNKKKELQKLVKNKSLSADWAEGYENGYDACDIKNAIWKVKYDELKAENERLNDQNGRLHEKNRKVSTEYTVLKAQAKHLVDALEKCQNVTTWMDAGDPYRDTLIKVINNAISEWNGEKGGEV